MIMNMARLGSLLATTMLASGSALAQPASAPAAPVIDPTSTDKSIESATHAPESTSIDEGGLADIVVTATRRSENLQSVPITIAAVTGDQLASAGVSSTRGLEQVVAGLIIATNATSTQPTLRGIGTRGSTAGDESNVALYVDGVYQPAMTSALFELLNVDRVEVLKGPQGTLFGRNATGGAINVITSKPGRDVTARLLLEYGRFNAVKAAAYLASPLSETLSIDLTGQYAADDGYIDDLVRGGKLGENRSHTLRGRIRWQPSEAVDIILSGSHVKTIDNSVYVTQPVARNTIALQTNPAVLIPTKLRQFAGDVMPEALSRQADVNLQASIDLGGVSLQSTTDYQRNRATFRTDSDSTTINRGSQYSPNNYINAWSQEIRLVSQGSSRFKWVMGGLAFGSSAGVAPLLSSTATATTVIRGRQRTRAYAGFGEATYEALDGLFLTGGLRYSWERKTLFPFVNVAAVPVSKSFDSWTPRASVRYEFADRANIYFTYSKGFKSGLYNVTSVQRTPVLPEKITSYEVGLKVQPASWMRTSLSAFKYDYTNLQVQARDVNSASVIFQNAGSAKVKGVDAEMAVIPTRGLTINLAGEYLHSRYTDFRLAQVNVPTRVSGILVGGNTTQFVDVSGNTLIRAPKWTVTAGAAYDFEIGSGKVRLSSNANYNHGYFHEVGNRLRQPSYVLVNANVGWWTSGDRLGVTLWAENLASENIVIYPLNSTNGDFFSYRKPATYGVRLNGKF